MSGVLLFLGCAVSLVTVIATALLYMDYKQHLGLSVFKRRRIRAMGRRATGVVLDLSDRELASDSVDIIIVEVRPGGDQQPFRVEVGVPDVRRPPKIGYGGVRRRYNIDVDAELPLFFDPTTKATVLDEVALDRMFDEVLAKEQAEEQSRATAETDAEARRKRLLKGEPGTKD